jgi:hypothetical protein
MESLGADFIPALAGAVSSQGKIGAVFAAAWQEANSEGETAALEFTNRMLEAGMIQIVPTIVRPTATSVPTAAAALEATEVVVQPSPTPTYENLDDQPVESSGSSWSGLVIGIFLAFVVVGGVFAFSIIRSRILVRKP